MRHAGGLPANELPGGSARPGGGLHLTTEGLAALWELCSWTSNVNCSLVSAAGSWSAAHGADMDAEAPAAVADDAVDEIDDPRELEADGARRRGPVRIRERAENRIDRRLETPVVADALKLPHVREPPVFVPREAQVLAVRERLAPPQGIIARRLTVSVDVRRVLLPHEPRAGVGHRTVAVVDEAAITRAAGLVEAVLSRAGGGVARDLREIEIGTFDPGPSRTRARAGF